MNMDANGSKSQNDQKLLNMAKRKGQAVTIPLFFHFFSTEETIIQDEEDLKSVAPPHLQRNL